MQPLQVRLGACPGERARRDVAVSVSPFLARAVRVALDAARASNGCVDPTLGSQLRAAGYDRTFSLVRERDAWRFASIALSQRDMEGRAAGRRRMRSACAGGDRARSRCNCQGAGRRRRCAEIAAATGAGALVSLGGDISVAGVAPAGGWSVRIADDHAAPLTSQGPTVAITTGGLATSSTVVRRWQTDQGEAHHILDPRSGRPAVTPWRTVTVAAGTCVDANVAATAAVVLGSDAIAWLVAARLPARLVRHDGSVVVVGGWPSEEARVA